MFHIVLSIASRFLFLGNMLQGLARGILTLRHLGVVSHLIPTLPSPPSTLLLDAPIPFVALSEQIISPYPAVDLTAAERFERQFPAFSSPLPSYQSALITVTPSHLPNFLPLFIILAMISGFVILVPEILYLYMSVGRITSAFTHASKRTSKLFRSRRISGFLPATLPSHLTSSRLFFSLVSLLLLWTGPPAIASYFTSIWFISMLFSQDQGSYLIVIILQRCGLLAVRDSRTPHVLNTIYEQITRVAAGYSDLVESSDLSYEDNEEQTIADCFPDSSHLADGRDLHETLVQSEDQEREAHDEQLKKHRLSAQYIYAQLVDAQDILRQQLELSRAREEKLHADLLAAQEEHESFKALVPTLKESDRKRRAWEIIATNARARCAETVFKLRADLTAAVDQVRDLQGQLDRQTELVQSITEESQVAHVRIKNAEAKLQREQDHWLRKKKAWSDKRVRIQERHEAETRRLTQEAQNSQEQIDSLRDEVSRLRAHGLDHNHLLPYQPPITRPRDAGQPPLPPEQIPDAGTPIGSAIDLDSSHRSPKSLPDAPFQDQEDGSPTHHAHVLQEELVATKELLRLAEEEVLTVRHDLDRSRGALREVKTRVRSLQSEWDMCQAVLREEQNARCADMIKHAEVLEHLRASRAESQSSMAEAEESRFRCSQATFLCTALQERVTELEAEVKKLKYSARACPTDTCLAPSDTEIITRDPDLQNHDSIHMDIPTSLPYLLDLSLPPSSSYSNSPLSLLEAALESCDVLDKCRYEEPLLEGFSLRPSRVRRTFLSEGSRFDSVDWPPIGSSLLPAGMNVRLDDDIGVQIQENAILLDRKAPVSELEEILDEPKSIGGPVRSLSINIHDSAPILSPVSRPLSALPASVSPVNFSSTPDRQEVTSSLRQDRGGRLRKGLNHLLRPQPHDIPKLDYGLPGDFVPSFGRVAKKRQGADVDDFDDFAFVIPLDCPTSTPVASRKRTLKKSLLGSGAGAAALAAVSPPPSRLPRRRICSGRRHMVSSG